tara:strand:+ start:1516 stop:2013 length:498 start_codon:yes stop_codon:yes gene_type:complete
MNIESYYKTYILNETITLEPKSLNFIIDDILLKNLKEKVEKKCINVGYIRPNSVKILSRTMGMINNADFTGKISYTIKYSADVFKMNNNQMIMCRVANMDKSQTICYLGDQEDSPVEIYLFKHHHVGNQKFANLKVNDIINVKIAGFKYEFKDTQMIAIANLEDN